MILIFIYTQLCLIDDYFSEYFVTIGAAYQQKAFTIIRVIFFKKTLFETMKTYVNQYIFRYFSFFFLFCSC